MYDLTTFNVTNMVECGMTLRTFGPSSQSNVSHVPTALGSVYIPVQEDFVIPYGIESALGFGGMLPSGNLFATIMFPKILISHDIADLFQPLALNVKIAVLQHNTEQIFRQAEDPART
jgi:two-component system, NtrC family, sensor kinase